MGLGTSTTKQTERGNDFTDYPIVTRFLQILKQGFQLLKMLTKLWIGTPDPLCQTLVLSPLSYSVLLHTEHMCFHITQRRLT